MSEISFVHKLQRERPRTEHRSTPHFIINESNITNPLCMLYQTNTNQTRTRFDHVLQKIIIRYQIFWSMVSNLTLSRQTQGPYQEHEVYHSVLLVGQFLSYTIS